MRGVLLGFLLLFIPLTRLTGVPGRTNGADIYVLVLGATLGFCLMASANHLMMVFMAVEMASVPSYVLAGMSRHSRMSSEAALKYAVYGGGTAGIMLYGISLLAGLTNTAHLPTLAVRLAEQLPSMAVSEVTVLALACLMVSIGLAFKLSAVPFHFWCPDVFEGAAAEIGGFLSVASKAAALALLVRVVVGLGALAPSDGVRPWEQPSYNARQPEMVATALQEEPAAQFSSTATSVALVDVAASRPEVSTADLGRVRELLLWLIAILSMITCTFGNLAAYGQTNIKRMLAYSTIAHAGYMMMAIPAILSLIDIDQVGASFAVASLALYIFVYLFMNLGAFAVVALLRNRILSEEIEDYAGLLSNCPGVTICLSVMLLSLIGLPPLSGFLGKFAIFAGLMDGFRQTGEPLLILVIFVGGLNSAVSLFYYLRVVRWMTMKPPAQTSDSCPLAIRSLSGLYICLLTIPTVAVILVWNPLTEMAVAAARTLFA